MGLFAVRPNSNENLNPNWFTAGAVIPGRENAVRWNLDLAKRTVRLHEPACKVHPMEFTAKLRKKAGAGMPRLETPEFIVSIGSQPELASPLDRAVRLATSDMAARLAGTFGMEPLAANLLIGMNSKYNIVTVAGSDGPRLPRSALINPDPRPAHPKQIDRRAKDLDARNAPTDRIIVHAHLTVPEIEGAIGL